MSIFQRIKELVRPKEVQKPKKETYNIKVEWVKSNGDKVGFCAPNKPMTEQELIHLIAKYQRQYYQELDKKFIFEDAGGTTHVVPMNNLTEVNFYSTTEVKIWPVLS